MHVMTVKAAFEDDRGTITDLVEDGENAVTIVASKAGAVRGNHYHERTAQWAYVLSGRLRVTTGPQEAELVAGQMVFNPMGEPHAWKAVEDTVCLVFTKGPRKGNDYERDTFRLDEPLLWFGDPQYMDQDFSRWGAAS